MPENISFKVGQDAAQSLEKANVIEHVPDLPGVYQIFDDDELLYVGKGKSLKLRLSQYQRAGRGKKHRKMRLLFKEMRRLELVICPSDKDALLLENQLIQELQPPYNVAGAYYFMYPYLGYRWASDDKNWLILTCSSDLDALEEQGFTYFGCYRSRHFSKEAFNGLTFLLGLLGHEDRALAKKYLDGTFSNRSAFRQIPRDITEPLQLFLRGESMTLLAYLAEQLLDKVGARKQSKEVQNSLRYLRRFFHLEPQKLRQTLESQGISSSAISQEDRDQLFILDQD